MCIYVRMYVCILPKFEVHRDAYIALTRICVRVCEGECVCVCVCVCVHVNGHVCICVCKYKGMNTSCM